jgi:hypothetical protein
VIRVAELTLRVFSLKKPVTLRVEIHPEDESEMPDNDSANLLVMWLLKNSEVWHSRDLTQKEQV